jgi:hypothetical protein
MKRKKSNRIIAPKHTQMGQLDEAGLSVESVAQALGARTFDGFLFIVG